MPGWRERLEEFRERSRSPPIHRNISIGRCGFGAQLTQWLLDWGWGRKAAVDIVREAYNKMSHEPLCQCPRIKRLAKCHSNPRNVQRIVEDIVRQDTFPPILNLQSSSVDSVLLPFDTFAWLQLLNPHKFAIHFGAKEGGVQDW